MNLCKILQSPFTSAPPECAARILAAGGFRTATTGGLGAGIDAGRPVVTPGNRRR
jgi:hypothetical protein